MLSFEEWQILLMSAVPVTELRLTIPVALALGIHPWKAFTLASIGNFLPIIPLLLLLESMIELFAKIPFLNTILTAIINKSRTKGEKVEKYGALGLFFLVAVPLPGTGVYTGAVLAFLFGIRFKYSFPSITLGMLVAGIAVTLAGTGVKEIVGYLYRLEYLFLALFLLAFIFWIIKSRSFGNNNRHNREE